METNTYKLTDGFFIVLPRRVDDPATKLLVNGDLKKPLMEIKSLVEREKIEIDASILEVL